MSRLLSSGFTYVYKFVLPVWIGIVVLGLTITTVLGIGRNMLSLPILPVIVALVALQLLPALTLKRVEMDSRNLYISNFSKQIVVPLADVTDVSENRWLHYHPVTIQLARPTEFGNRITFAPDMSDTWFRFLSHPVVAQLRTAVARARDQGPE